MNNLKQFCLGVIIFTQISLSAIPNLVLMGPPGCGKGTFSTFLKQTYGYHQISIGDILRYHARQGTPIGLKVLEAKKNGKYLDDTIVFELIRNEISACLEKNIPFILDNFPRNAPAFNFMISLFVEKSLINNIKIVRFNMADEESFRRLSGRSVCSNRKCACSFNDLTKKPRVNGICDLCQSKLIRRPGDTQQNTAKRLNLYKTNVRPLADTAKLFGIQLFDVDATNPIISYHAFCMSLPELSKEFPVQAYAKL